MTGFQRHALRTLVVENSRSSKPANGNDIWVLNLDQIESGTGRVISKQMVSVEKLGPSTYPFDAGTVLYSKLRPYLNKVVVADECGVATTELVPLRCNQEKLLPHYLAYFLRSPEFLQFANIVVAGAKMPRMVMGEFWDYKIPVPSLPEQRRIATILDQADTLRAKRREALAQLDELQRAIFIEMFGGSQNYPEQTLDSLCDLITDGTHQTPTYADDGVLFLSAKNVTTGIINWSDIKFIPDWLHAELHKRLAPRRNDILLAKNGTTGVAAIVDRDCVFDIYVSLALLRPKQGVLSSYLHAAINSPISKRQFNGALKGIGVPNLHLKDIRSTKIPNPPLKVQQEFEQRIAVLARLQEQNKSSLSEMDSLFTALQHSAFRGEL